MAVRIRLGSNGAPRRMAGACFPVATSPHRAFGGWDHRVTASYGTVHLPARGPQVAGGRYAIPPDTTGAARYNSNAVPVFCPTWSIVRPALPRRLPWAGQIPHGIPGITVTPAVGQPAQDQVVRPRINPRGPIAQGRVTTQPRPRFFWKRQGGGMTA